MQSVEPGLRVGIAAVKGLAATLGKPALGVHALDALALAAGVRGEPIVALISAAKGELYVGWRWVETDLSVRSLRQDGVMSFEKMRLELSAQFADASIVLIGSGAAAHEAEKVLLPIRNAKAEHLLVEFHERVNVRHHECDVPELHRADCGRLAHRRGFCSGPRSATSRMQSRKREFGVNVWL